MNGDKSCFYHEREKRCHPFILKESTALISWEN